jgi:hypothetical protein
MYRQSKTNSHQTSVTASGSKSAAQQVLEDVQAWRDRFMRSLADFTLEDDYWRITDEIVRVLPSLGVFTAADWFPDEVTHRSHSGRSD